MMQIKNYLLVGGLILGLLPNVGNAQTISTFDDLALPGADTNYASTLLDTVDVSYSFQSGNVLFYGAIADWGGYSGFNYTNMQDDTTGDYTNDKSAITGRGYDSTENYGTCFIPIDILGPDPTATIPIGAELKGSAEGHPAQGAYITNTTYTYYYMQNNFQAGNWYKLIVRGYLLGQKTADSVVFLLGEVTDSTTHLVDSWIWVDFSTLGDVDSLTFDVSSNDTVGGFGMNIPAYFAIDNLTTSDSSSDSTGIGSALFANQLAFRIYPNPVQSILTLETRHPVNVEVYDLAGKLLIKVTKTLVVPVSQLSPGVYILKAFDPETGQSGVQKFIRK